MKWEGEDAIEYDIYDGVVFGRSDEGSICCIVWMGGGVYCDLCDVILYV